MLEFVRIGDDVDRRNQVVPRFDGHHRIWFSIEICDQSRFAIDAGKPPNQGLWNEALQAAHIRTILAGMSLPPNYGAQYIHEFERMYRDLAAKYKLPFIPFLLEDIRQNLAKTPGLMGPDGIHPTPAGNRLVARTVFRTLAPLLKKT